MIIWQALGSIFLILAVSFKLGSSNGTGDNVKDFAPAKTTGLVSESRNPDEKVGVELTYQEVNQNVSTDPTSVFPKVPPSPLLESSSGDVNTNDPISLPPQVPNPPLVGSTSGDINTTDLISVPPFPPQIPTPPLTDSDSPSPDPVISSDSPEVPPQPPTTPAKIPEPSPVLSLLIFGIFSLARKYQA